MLFGWFGQLDRIERKLDLLLRGDIHMAASLADLDAAIAAQGTEITTLQAAVTQVDTDIANLLAKIAAGTPVDVTAELTAIQANTTNITSAVTAAQAADATVNPPPPSA